MQHTAMKITYSDIALAPFVDDNALAALLDQCFPSTFEGRFFFKQEPHSRIVAHAGNILVGQVGIDRRVISVNGKILKIIGTLQANVDYRGLEIVNLAAEIAKDRNIDPAILGAAYKSGLYDTKKLKKVWHCLARYGLQEPSRN